LIGEGEPLTCPKCHGRMKIISFILPCLPTGRQDEEVIEKDLKHLGFLEMEARPPPKPKASLVTMHFDYLDSQISFADSFYADPDYSIDFYGSSRFHQVICSTFQSIILTFQSDLKVNISRVCRVKRMTCRSKSDRGSSAVRPRSWKEV